MSPKTKFNVVYWNHICFILTPFLTLFPNPFYLPLLTYRTLQHQMNHQLTLRSVCIYIWHDFHIRDRSYRFESNFSVFN